MLPVLQIGPFAIQTPGLILLLTLWIGLNLAERRASTGPSTGSGQRSARRASTGSRQARPGGSARRAGEHGLTTSLLNNLILAAILGGAIGGRLIYAARFPSAFLQSPLSLISLNPALFDAWGGLVIAALAAFIYGQRKGLALWPSLDALTPLLATLMVGLGLAHLAEGSAFGKPTDLPWGIELWGAKRHPTQIYETLAALLTLGLLWFRQAQPGGLRQAESPPGTRFLLLLALTSGARLFLEALRGDSVLISGGIRLAQIIAWLVLAAALILLERLRSKGAPSSTPAETCRVEPPGRAAGSSLSRPCRDPVETTQRRDNG